jgi:ADP-heptose:LPS heptosyltransferase
VKKILVIRFSSIGDIVLTTPVIRCIKEQVEDVELHFITKDDYRQILSENPYIDKLHFLQSSLWKTAQILKRERYDYVIDLHHNQRTWLLKRMLGVKSFSFPKLNFEKWLMVNFKINQLPSLHIVDRYFEAVKHIGVENDGKGLDFFVAEGLNEKQTIEGPYIAWAIGAKQLTKQLPVHKIIEALNSEYFPTMKVVLLGGKEDTSKADQIIAGTLHNNVVSLVGKCNLQASALVVQSSQLVITNDTGLMHIAAAMQRPIVSIWGNTIPEFGMFPYYGNSQTLNRIIQVPELACRPCSKIGYTTCPKGHFQCMQNIAIPELIQQVKILLQ